MHTYLGAKARSLLRSWRQRAFALILVLFLTLIMSILGFAATYIATLDARGATSEFYTTESMYAAIAGVQQAKAQIQSTLYASTATPPGTWAGLTTAQTYKCQNASTWTLDNSNAISSYNASYTISATYYSSSQAYLINSTGNIPYSATHNASSHSVSAYITFGDFSTYAMFTGSELTTSGGTVWFAGSDVLTGPVHTNGYYSIADNPQFSMGVTSANTGDSYYTVSGGTATYTQSGIGTNSHNDSYFYNYNSGYSTDYPTAEGGSSAFYFAGGQPSVSLNNTGSSYVQTHVSSGYSFAPGASSSALYGNITLTFGSAGTVTVVEPSSVSSSVSSSITTHHSGSSTSYSTSYSTTFTTSFSTTTSTLSGPTTIYTNPGSGNTTLVSGTVNGNVTIGTPQELDITGNLVYNDKSSNTLGLLSDNYVYVNTNDNVQANLEIDASIMAPSYSFGVLNYSSGSFRGTLTLFGGIIEAYRGAVGTFSGTTYLTGYQKNYVYDDKLLAFPPPNYPPINNKLKVMSYQDTSALH